jgi:hypothetical protein
MALSATLPNLEQPRVSVWTKQPLTLLPQFLKGLNLINFAQQVFHTIVHTSYQTVGTKYESTI